MSDNGKKKWFNESRYGMFIHWGAYSVAARGEWFMNREMIGKDEYTEKYVDNWHAEKYDPSAWAALAKTSGMGYMVLTARHHDGFALWDSKVNTWNAARLGPKRDLVAPYVEAVRKAGLKVGLYYSPAAWTHPDYPGAFFRDWPGEKDWRNEDSRLRFIEYYRSELRELLTGYGKIDYLWFDGCIPTNIDGDETLKMVRELQPDMLVNNRLGKPFDIKTCEQTVNPAAAGQDWESCMTLNRSWGYHAGDKRWKNPVEVIDILLTCAKSAGNLLLNIGPRPDGTVPEESVKILRKVGKWIKRNRESIANSERHPLSWNSTARPITAKGNRFYLHFLNDPCGSFCWAEVKNRVLSASLLMDGNPIEFRQEGNRLFLERIPFPLPDSPATTIVLELDGRPETLIGQTTFWIPE
jgi:alpha-L-fucosidase